MTRKLILDVSSRFCYTPTSDNVAFLFSMLLWCWQFSLKGRYLLLLADLLHELSQHYSCSRIVNGLENYKDTLLTVRLQQLNAIRMHDASAPRKGLGAFTVLVIMNNESSFFATHVQGGAYVVHTNCFSCHCLPPFCPSFVIQTIIISLCHVFLISQSSNAAVVLILDAFSLGVSPTAKKFVSNSPNAELAEINT